MTSLIAIGECMIELRHRGTDVLELGFAGDTYNTAVYAGRTSRELGSPLEVGYLTGVGDDHYSRLMRGAWADQHVRDRSTTVPGKLPGLYTIRVDAAGEREFAYWRSDSAARALFTGTGWVDGVEGDLIYLTAISLQLMPAVVVELLLVRLAALRRAGARIALGTNYRPAGWPSAAAAAERIDAVRGQVDVVFTSVDDETHLGRGGSRSDIAAAASTLGVPEVVVTDGVRGAVVLTADGAVHVPAIVAPVVDSTAAGDAFAGAYLAARTAGLAPADAAAGASAVAAIVVGHPGALAPAAATLWPARVRS